MDREREENSITNFLGKKKDEAKVHWTPGQNLKLKKIHQVFKSDQMINVRNTLFTRGF